MLRIERGSRSRIGDGKGGGEAGGRDQGTAPNANHILECWGTDGGSR